MARKDPRPEVNRRKFLTGVAVAGAATAVAPQQNIANAATTATLPTGPGRSRPSALPPSGAVAAAETGTPKELAQGRPSGRLGFHGRRHQDARHRVPAVQCGLELPRAARVADQLRRQQEARVPHLHARGMRGRDGPRLLQGRRQADDDPGPRHGRPAARLHGGLQRLVRPGAGHRRRRQRSRCLQAPARRADLPFGAGHQRAGARLHQVGRHAGLAAALRAVVRARLQDRDDAALCAGCDLARRRSAAGADQERRAAHHPALRADLAAAGRYRCRARGGATPRQCGASGDRGRSRRPHAQRHQAPGATRRAAAGAGGRPGRAHELPEDASSQPCARRDRPGRRGARHGAVGLSGPP